MEISNAYELLALAEQASAHAYSADSAAWTARVDARASELSSAVDALLGEGDREAALRIVASLRVYAQDSGRIDEIRMLADDLVSRADLSEPSPALAGVELVRGELAFRQGEQALATVATEEARAIAAAVGDSVIQARAEINLARVAFRDGDAGRIEAHARVAASLSDDPRVESGAMHMLGWAAYTAGDVEGAIALFEKNAEVYAAREDLVGMAGECANVGELALELGDVPRATRFLQRALDVGVKTNSRYLIPSLLASVAVLAAASGRHAEALELEAAAARQYEQAGLIPDPGAGFSAELRQIAVRDVGEARAAELSVAGRARSWDDAIALAWPVLSTTQPSDA
jgi:tetratricopeptide (TPR) repeat protein